MPDWNQPPRPLGAAFTFGDTGERPFAWLGTHQVDWLGRSDLADIPWFVSRRRLERIRPRSWPTAAGRWALDSGAFTEANLHGGWATVTAADYVDTVRRAAETIGGLQWVAPMDLCCEPGVVERVAAAGWLAEQVRLPAGCPDDPVLAHLVWTVRNFVDLRTRLDRPGDPPVIPVVQGWTLDQYAWCLELYEMAGVDLTVEPLVGIGSTCRRDADLAILAKVAWLGEAGIRAVHAFGLKGDAVAVCAHRIASYDSMAWSYNARRRGRRVDGCTAGHVHCGNCPVAARAWRDRLVARTDTSLHRFRTAAATLEDRCGTPAGTPVIRRATRTGRGRWRGSPTQRRAPDGAGPGT